MRLLILWAGLIFLQVVAEENIQDEENEDCASNPCRNGATCTNTSSLLNDFFCQCSPGFTGERCDVDINECASLPCQNGGLCVNDVARFYCICLPPFTGATCELFDFCASEPCQNGGTCRDEPDTFVCICDINFTGLTCESRIFDPCESNPCQNQGTCTRSGGNFTCSCTVGFTGKVCEINVNECQSHPCQNMGRCNDKINGFICKCLHGFKGQFCEINVNDCFDNCCPHGTQCIDLIHGFVCRSNDVATNLADGDDDDDDDDDDEDDKAITANVISKYAFNLCFTSLHGKHPVPTICPHSAPICQNEVIFRPDGKHRVIRRCGMPTCSTTKSWLCLYRQYNPSFSTTYWSRCTYCCNGPLCNLREIPKY